MQAITIDEGFWAFEQRILLPPGLHLPTRCYVVRLEDGGWVIFNPIPKLPEAKAEIDALGPVRALIAQTSLHHLGLPAAMEAWPDAKLYGIPALTRKRPDLTFHGTVDAMPAPLWSGVLEQHVIAGTTTHEVAFFHRPSHTLILADLAFHLPRPTHRLTRWFFTLTGSWGAFGPSRLFKTTIRDRRALAASIQTLLAWQPRRIVMAHGLPVEQDATGALARAFAFLPR